ncbi:hypothetical protein RFK95_18280 [Acinetobacter pittii]|uniref:hypothetical protein n=1 Tax=Acinetobacter pittii TaxID=48296 RepID=UPI0009A403E2|nr:hypothetical protein [Acinetobacter pittii]MDR0067269.1 hypothetical protein [Acinetobacter sp. 11520]MBM0877429.1 hypothetical protein [Acinetobacter pittii]MCU4620133.1 hypothetical protein [Acinetobacter pittii]MDQ9034811.1 hypothetical protein [Acinetobacter pittii]MDQ9079768.1 hypothetical protein [Acinetobacter pittii]
MGKDYDYVRNEMDLPRLRALGAYQQSNPPAHIGIQRLCRILEAFMGIEETPQAITVSDDEEEDMLEVLESFPQGG